MSGREGYVSLLAMSFALGLALFGSALAVGLRSYLVAAATQQREILDRITLESAAHEALGRLAAGELHSIKPEALADVTLNDKRVSVDLSLPEGKYDLTNSADRAPMLAAIRRQGLAERAQSSMPSTVSSVVELSHAWRLSAAEEDCLRRVVTAGRAPEPFRSDAAEGDGEGIERSAAAGDQVDLRMSLGSARGQTIVWIRARLTGEATGPWRVHDYRRLVVESPIVSCGSAR